MRNWFTLILVFSMHTGTCLSYPQHLVELGEAFLALDSFQEKGLVSRAREISNAYARSIFELKVELHSLALDHFYHQKQLSMPEKAALKQELCTFPGILQSDWTALIHSLHIAEDILRVCDTQTPWFSSKEDLIKIQIADQMIYSDILAQQRIFTQHIQSEIHIETLVKDLTAVGLLFQPKNYAPQQAYEVWHGLQRTSKEVVDEMAKLTHISIDSLSSYAKLIKVLQPVFSFVFDGVTQVFKTKALEKALDEMYSWFPQTLEICMKCLQDRKAMLIQEGNLLYRTSGEVQKLRSQPLAELINSQHVDTFTRLRQEEMQEINHCLTKLQKIKEAYFKARFFIVLDNLK
ncbi:MAG: hypothetical protein OXT67_08055 [Zetaproteobacteria bacterium]|nr:hypothetical protein [Zetaproteobacteria bacterium]